MGTGTSPRDGHVEARTDARQRMLSTRRRLHHPRRRHRERARYTTASSRRLMRSASMGTTRRRSIEVDFVSPPVPGRTQPCLSLRRYPPSQSGSLTSSLHAILGTLKSPAWLLVADRRSRLPVQQAFAQADGFAPSTSRSRSGSCASYLHHTSAQ